MKNSLICRFTSFLIMSCLALTTIAFADRGTFVMRANVKENIDVYDAGQKAIIAWNNNQELMILSTDKYVSQNTKVLEFMPLPSKPSRVEKFGTECFTAVDILIKSHRPRINLAPMAGSMRSKANAARQLDAESSVKVVFHEKIGAHDITIAKTENLHDFILWIKKFMKNNQLEFREEDAAGLKPIIQGYLKDGYHYYVFDVIELSTQKKSIEPILYVFESKKLYFPLRVTQLSKGFTNIALYLFTPFKTDVWGTRTGFVSAFYTINGRVDENYPIKFVVNERELKSISNELEKFFKNSPHKIWFSASKFQGETSNLTADFVMKPILGPRNSKKSLTMK